MSKESTMKMVFCSEDGQMHPANRVNKDPKVVVYRCTKCGRIH